MILELEYPFNSVWKKGYLRKSSSDGRRRVDLFNSDSDRTTMSYSRYLMCVKMGEIISDDYEVDHINGDSSDDSLDNLQVLTKKAHLEKTSSEMSTGRTTVDLVCANCNKTFSREIKNVKPNTSPKCSRRCNGQYSRKIQLNLL